MTFPGGPRKIILDLEKIVDPRFWFLRSPGPPKKNHAAMLFTALERLPTFSSFLRTSGISRNVTIRGGGAKSAVPGAAPRCPD